MIHPSVLVVERVRQRLRAEATDPSLDPAVARSVALAEVRRFNDLALSRGEIMIDDEAAFVRDVLASVTGFGALQPLLDDPEIEEIWLNGPESIHVARGGVSERLALRLSDSQLRDVVERMLQSTGRRVDISQPFVDASLPDGSRLHVAIADVVRGGWSVNIRKFLPRYRSLDALVAHGALPAELATILHQAMLDGQSIIVSGATHAGKTTFLGALLASCVDRQRIVTVEETFELAVDGPDIVSLQGRQASLEGTGEITLRRLVKEALRMRPDRLVVGEVRDAEALDLVLALNTGVPGAATVHASSAEEALDKLTLLPLLAGRNIDRAFVAPALARAVDLVVHCVRDDDGTRRVHEVIAPNGEVADGRIVCRTLYAYGGDVKVSRRGDLRRIGDAR
ncbi:pilus assembly protein CpaF [Microbacterium phyllosphaerae]|uniref:Pilus assembly protein CpaF n=1 Tax=Microbacterium phyllosphaerae TaxID=124798 RepID=A0ABS4WT03_9MICO|nr:ATPase, T2SS/T4P/T4SS family [Microbacterium phyllosphaerae]MBP2379341.1 pilus assembly protein CpaF [Microbacterium phyllosphaerae]